MITFNIQAREQRRREGSVSPRPCSRSAVPFRLCCLQGQHLLRMRTHRSLLLPRPTAFFLPSAVGPSHHLSLPRRLLYRGQSEEGMKKYMVGSFVCLPSCPHPYLGTSGQTVCNKAQIPPPGRVALVGFNIITY